MQHLSLFLVALLLVGCRLVGAPGASTSPEASTSPVASTSPEASIPYDGVRPPTAPPIEPESNTRSITPVIESPEIGVDYDVYLSLHCGYSKYWHLRFGGTEWRFTENGSDGFFVEGTLRLVSADSVTLTVDGVAHPLVPVTEDGGPMCL
jgi:hypothetical protein